MRNKFIATLFVFFFVFGFAKAQEAADFFNQAARSYVKTEREQALAKVNEGLQKFPGDQKLQELKEKLEQEQEEEQQQQDQQQQNENQQQQDSENQQSEGEQSEEQQENQDGEQTDEDNAKESQEGDAQNQSEDQPENANDQMDADLADRQKAMEEFKEKLKAMNLTPEQAAQILENMNAAELRYIQQNKKRPTERPKKGIPDW